MKEKDLKLKQQIENFLINKTYDQCYFIRYSMIHGGEITRVILRYDSENKDEPSLCISSYRKRDMEIFTSTKDFLDEFTEKRGIGMSLSEEKNYYSFRDKKLSKKIYQMYEQSAQQNVEKRLNTLSNLLSKTTKNKKMGM